MQVQPGTTNILVTGPPGCGKSTLIMRLAGNLPVPARGFTTAEIRDGSGARVGFRIETLSGMNGILAHSARSEGPRVGRYRVNLSDLDRIGAAEIEEAVDDTATGLIVVDEIARMELFSERFRRAVARALDSRKPLLGAIQARPEPFLDRVRSRKDTFLIRLSRGNVNVEADRVLAILLEMLNTR